ncbi:hypothetical protein [Fibrobacter sp. UWB7]|uniref:hypothetical protein n=1 Tax=Fibrobacter sp. UWB7 TaxID=1896206 RepID=UPI00091CC795|nr:hypothetical protein [Fibrobacter sp. UWB7]SHN01801.1 hypothetical protein SAMN05720467_3086 [Fibrobacter sp. UWB7]
MSENEVILNQDRAKTSLENAEICVKEYLGERERPVVFYQFDDAAYYYREKAISAVKNAINTAAECGDEISEVQAYKNLFDVIICNLETSEKKKLFKDCYEPLVNILTNDVAKGLLYYQLGHSSEKLDIPSESFFENAVKLNNKNVLDEDVFKTNPKFIFDWLELYLTDPAQKDTADEYEKLLTDIVENTESAGEYFYKMANLLKEKSLAERADIYYRLCIPLGYKNAVEDSTFFTENYEDEFIEWFNNQLEKQTDLVAIKNQCFVSLWKANEKNLFSRSKKLWAEKITDKDFKTGCREYSIFADDGFDWAENWLLAEIEDKNVQGAISDNVIERWFNAERKDEQRDIALGMLFVNGRCAHLKNSQKYYICISKYYLEKGEFMAALASFLCTGKNEISVAFDYSDFEPVLRSAVKSHYVELIQQKIDEKIPGASRNPLPISTDSYGKFTEKKINGLTSLKQYIQTSRLTEKLFRSSTEKPNCTRYFLLNKMAVLAKNSDDIDFREQESSFREQAKLELKDAISDFDTMALCVWLEEHIYSEKADDKATVTVLCDLIQKIEPKKLTAPYLLLANYWASKKIDDDIVPTVLSWILDNSNELDWFKSTTDLKELIKKTFEILSLNKK